MATTDTRAERVIPGVGTLHFEDQPYRRYWLTPEGSERRRRLPSVTTVLGDVIAKPGLVKWAARLGENYERVRDEAAERGTTIHKFIEHYLTTGEALEVGDEHAPYVQSAARFLFAYDPKPLAIELLVCHPELGYAGRLDLIADIGGTTTLLDFKTNPNGRVYPEAHIQAYAYEVANERCGGLDIQQALLVGISPTGYRVVEATDTAKTWGAAIALYGELKTLERELGDEPQ